MYPLLETILLKDGLFYNVHYHADRMHRSVRALLGKDLRFSLYEMLSAVNYPNSGIYKCRITYSFDVWEIAFHPYTYPLITHLQMVVADNLDYSLKYADRKGLLDLKNQFGKGEEVMIIRNGWVTDTSFSNIIYRQGNQWLTPAHPLLKGTQRQYLLDAGILAERDITAMDILQCDELALVNAMIDFEHRIRIHKVLNLSQRAPTSQV